MGVEQENSKIEIEMKRCSWCGEEDREEKVNASPGDDLENPGAYHEKCFEALQMSVFLADTEIDKTEEELVKMANQMVGIKKKKK